VSGAAAAARLSQLTGLARNSRKGLLVAAARQWLPSTPAIAPRVSAGGRHRRRNPL
jgi:hypothetical protein